LATRSEPVPAGLRHELKLVCEEAAQARLVAALRLDRAGLRTLFPTRVVQSVYLDTTFRRALEENLAGIGRREKLRFRWYGEAADLVHGTLERKRRESSLGWKESLALGAPVRVRSAGRREFVLALARLAGSAVAGEPGGAVWRERLLHGFEPAQWIRYRREYLTSADGRLRVTLDRELRFHELWSRARLDDRWPSPTPRLLVLEVKCAPEDLDRAADLIGRLPVPVGRCSKFVLAHDADQGPLPSILGA